MKLPTLPGFDPQAFEKYFKNTGWLMMARVGTLLIKMLTGIAVANYLGSSGNGILNYPMALITFFMAASALGLDSYITRELLQRPQSKNILLGTAFALRLSAGLIVLPLIYFTYFVINNLADANPGVPFNFIAIVSFVCVIQSINIIDSYFQSQVQGKKIMLVQVIANILSALVKIILILVAAPIAYFIWALLADAIFLAISYLCMYHKSKESVFHWRFDKNLAKYLIQMSWPLAFSAILVTLYMKIDQIMISSYLDSSALGIYSTVVSLSESWYFIPVATVSALFPAIMNARQHDEERYRNRLQNLYDLMSFISLGIAIVMTFASPLVYKILYKADFAAGAEVLSIHIWAGIFVFLGSASGQYLIAEGYTKLSLVRTGVGALINIILNMWWIPIFGIKGAAWASLIAYAVATFYIILIPKTRVQGIMMLKSIFQINLIRKLIKF
ncbi:flippase [Albibacterium sp.]|uniref:flippase n=1 Tax=Albibacterium sp. TaxID=2952885 RepID=UPI002B7FCCDA|nr:flippase [Albibacterium sp.]HUH17672.1 flippase [Albibacterium sp.]